MAKLYTRTGDDGETGLWANERTGKDSLRITAIGNVDELNAAIGWARVACTESMDAVLRPVQSDLFDLGAALARSDGAKAGVLAGRIDWAERQIDAASVQAPELKVFILPGGSEAAARLHLVRTICRRAERACVRLGRTQAVPEAGLIYLNRLSDLLFALARQANHEVGVADVPWKSRDKN